MMQFNALVGIILFLFTFSISATTINGRFTILQNDSSKLSVLLQINTNTGTDDLGGATIIFSFDTTSINFPNFPVRNVDYILHNFAGGNYSTATVTKAMENKVWVNIDLPFINSNNGTIVSASPSWTDVVTLNFNRTNPGESPGLSWLFSSLFWGIYDADNLTLWNIGEFEGNFGVSVQIEDGWNLVSVPGVNPIGQNIDIWWSGRDPEYGVYKLFNGSYASIISTNPTEGYWMNHTGSNIYNTGDEWPVEGIQVVQHNPITANAGWNLIGGYENIVELADLTTTPPGLITGLCYSYHDSYQISNIIAPGLGYFIKLTGDGQINIPSGMASGGEGIDELFSNNWGKITFKDSLNRNFSLYLVDGEIDLNLYELPPVPPESIFDIRFESGRIVESLNNGSQTILMSGIVYPITVNVENISVSLLDELGKRIDSELNPGKEIIITNRSTKRLMVVSTEFATPSNYSLEQNYPNPFNPTTKIMYNVPIASHIIIKIYDVLGKEIKVLVNEFTLPGKYVVDWDAREFASGVYFYTIQASDFIQTKKMILLK